MEARPARRDLTFRSAAASATRCEPQAAVRSRRCRERGHDHEDRDERVRIGGSMPKIWLRTNRATARLVGTPRFAARGSSPIAIGPLRQQIRQAASGPHL